MVLKGYSQTKTITGPLTYGPVPYRTLEQTIGEDYVVLPMDQFEKKSGYDVLKLAKEPNTDITDSTLSGKQLRLIAIDTKKTAHLKDSNGLEYLCDLHNGCYNDLAPVYDINEAKKKIFQKTIWLNNNGVPTGKLNATGNKLIFVGERLDPLKVIGIELSDLSDCPVKFILQTAKGEVGYLPVDVSGTNTDRRFIFEKYFFERDPKLIYNFTPQEWHYIKAGLPQIGMSTQAVRLCIGPPNDINRTVAGKNVTEQYVYGFNKFSYYYFTNGKLTNIQN